MKEPNPQLFSIFGVCATALQGDSGQDLAEYALFIALIAMAVIAAVTLFGGNIQAVFNNIAEQLQ